LRANLPADVAAQPQPAELKIDINSRLDWAQVVEQNFVVAQQRVLVMGSAKTLATLASVAAIAFSILAFSWIGLALLGY
jgi:hypothetical protein